MGRVDFAKKRAGLGPGDLADEDIFKSFAGERGGHSGRNGRPAPEEEGQESDAQATGSGHQRFPGARAAPALPQSGMLGVWNQDSRKAARRPG